MHFTLSQIKLYELDGPLRIYLEKNIKNNFKFYVIPLKYIKAILNTV